MQACWVDEGDGLQLDFNTGWDGSPDTDSRFVDMAELAEINAVKHEEYNMVTEIYTTQFADPDAPWGIVPSSDEDADSVVEPDGPRLTRAQRKAFDREIHWREILRMDGASVQFFLEATRKEYRKWVEWAPVQPVPD